jgi:hypothetical protein
MHPRSRYNYELALKLHPNYLKQKWQRVLELHPDYSKLHYQYVKRLYPDLMQRQYERAKQLHPDLIKKQMERFHELHSPEERRKIWRNAKRNWKLRKKIFNTLKGVKIHGQTQKKIHRMERPRTKRSI